MATTEPIRNKKDVKKLAKYFIDKGQLRNHVLIVLGVHTALRISDLLGLTWADVYDFADNKFYASIELTEKKTGKTKRVALNTTALRALTRYFKQLGCVQPNSFIFTNNRKQHKAISRTHAWHIVKQAAKAVKLLGRIACHSLRKTFGYHAWKQLVPVAIIMDIYNHTSFAVTKRYLGISQDDKNSVYLGMCFGL